MTTVQSIYTFLQEKTPFEMQMDFDNAGFLVGRSTASVSKILIALDITEAVIDEAIETGAQLIISHHPVIWGGVKSITDQTLTGRKLLLMAEKGISAICAHTNLDAVSDGVNDALAIKLGLTDISQLHQDGIDSLGRPYGIGRVGYTSTQPLSDFLCSVKTILGANGIRFVDGGRPVHKVAVGGGSCSNMVNDAIACGCDTFVTSDVKYDGFLDAKALGLNLVDAGHFPTENVICSVLKQWIDTKFPHISVSVSSNHKEVFSYL